MSVEEKREDIIKKRAVALDSLEALARVASSVLEKIDYCTAESRWALNMAACCEGSGGSCCRRCIWKDMVMVITYEYVPSDIDMPCSISDNNKRMAKGQQEMVNGLRKEAEDSIKKIRDGATLEAGPVTVGGVEETMDNDGVKWTTTRDRPENADELNARREELLKRWDKLVEAADKAYADIKAVFDAVDAQSAGWTLIDYYM